MPTLPTTAGDRQSRRSVVAFGVAVFLALTTALAYNLYSSHQIHIVNAQGTASKLTRALAEHTVRSFEAVDTVLRSTATGLEHLIIEHGADPARTKTFLQTSGQGLSFVRALSFIGEDGELKNDSRPERPPSGIFALDRDYFQAHAAGRVGLVIGTPMKSRVDDEWFISLSRRIEFPNGQFAGVLTALVEPKSFQAFYQALQVGARGSATLVMNDGVVLAREPNLESAIGQAFKQSPLFEIYLPKAPQGCFIATSPRGRKDLPLHHRRQVPARRLRWAGGERRSGPLVARTLEAHGDLGGRHPSHYAVRCRASPRHAAAVAVGARSARGQPLLAPG